MRLYILNNRAWHYNSIIVDMTMQRPNTILFYILLLTTAISSCRKVKTNDTGVYTTKTEIMTHQDSLFKMERDSFRMVLNDEIFKMNQKIENIDMVMYDYESEIDDELEEKYIDLQETIATYVAHLEEKKKQIDAQKLSNWQDFMAESTSQTKKTKIEYKELKINLKKTFQVKQS